MSRVKTNHSVEQIDALLEHTNSLMEGYKNKQNYGQAQNCRVTIEKLKREREARRVRDMENRHNQQQNDLSAQRQLEMKQLFQFWQSRLQNQQAQAQKNTKELQAKHLMQLQRQRESLEISLPLKVKESVQCLNLRAMEEFMKKQKNYAQAEIIQKQIAEMEKAEKQKWMANRNSRINNAIKHLKQKQQNEMANLQKNIKAQNSETKKIKTKQEQLLALKFTNLERELTMKQQKQKLALKGQFTSKGGQGSPLLTKSRLLKSSY